MKKIQSIGKIRYLIEKHQFLKEILGEWNQQDKVVNVKFERMDEELLFYDGGDFSSRFCESSGCACFSEYVVYFIDSQSQIIDKLLFDNNSNNQVINDLLNDLLNDYSVDDIKYIALAKHISILRIDYNEEVERCFCDSTFRDIQIYNLPYIGLKNLIDQVNNFKNENLYLVDYESGIYFGDKKYLHVQKLFDILVSDFTFGVYVNGLGDFVAESKRKELTASLNDINVSYRYDNDLFFFSLERTNIKTKIVFSGKRWNDNPEIQIWGFHGTYLNMENLVRDFIIAWRNIEVEYDKIFQT